MKEAVGIVLKNEDGKVLLLDHVKTNKITVPGGGVEDGEYPVDAIVREVLEETGLVLKKHLINLFNYTTINYPEHGDTIVRVYTYRHPIKDTPVNIEPEKHRKLYWGDVNDIPDEVTSHLLRIYLGKKI